MSRRAETLVEIILTSQSIQTRGSVERILASLRRSDVLRVNCRSLDESRDLMNEDIMLFRAEKRVGDFARESLGSQNCFSSFARLSDNLAR